MKCNKFLSALAALVLMAGSGTALAAEQVCLASIAADTDGDGTQETAELWGTQLTSGSSYYGDLLLMVKNKNGRLITAFTPSLEGGYANLLQKGHFTGKGEQLVVRSLSGAAQNMQVRIIDAALPDAVQEIYNGSDNMGVDVTASYRPDFTAQLDIGGETETAKLPHERDYYIDCGLYDANGNLLKPYRAPQAQMSGVTVVKGTDGARDRLATLQNVSGVNGEDVLAKIAGSWEYDHGWQLLDREFYTQIVQNGEFRRNLVFGNGMLYRQQAGSLTRTHWAQQAASWIILLPLRGRK